ncbi:MAG: hypothetical protein AAGG48_31785 [Planctomycetota bacterium]
MPTPTHDAGRSLPTAGSSFPAANAPSLKPLLPGKEPPPQGMKLAMIRRIQSLCDDAGIWSASSQGYRWVLAEQLIESVHEPQTVIAGNG